MTHATEMADRVAIHELLIEYGAALDRRDFDGFGKLFGKDGIYEAGPSTTRGAEAGPLMRNIFATGPNATNTPNFHLFFNEVVTFDGPDRARARSTCVFMTPDKETKRPTVAVSAHYDDELVREDGRWVFARRTLKPITNGPPAPLS
ncbi:nuclear transport factor 2 family protein [Sphingobium nicotianae]|uniref:Nuclear transport factor 2 family protein n=1 Tax=Sphingobium nicotianae TaxID=2782607 RepID=A0A9X1IQ52_9SPHN|nr:nuclear transport factor 2 family protein [Sphingobium nicotianae]MBT2186434.1 nuclear transport factor 2 family protein [Sphingobium nicotianae]